MIIIQSVSPILCSLQKTFLSSLLKKVTFDHLKFFVFVSLLEKINFVFLLLFILCSESIHIANCKLSVYIWTYLSIVSQSTQYAWSKSSENQICYFPFSCKYIVVLICLVWPIYLEMFNLNMIWILKEECFNIFLYL